jgi:transposase InsO family protein
MTQARISQYVGISTATVSRIVSRAGMSKLSDLDPAEPVIRYEHDRPGDLIHIDTKKLGKIERAGHRVTRDRRDRSRGVGWEVLYVAVDDHARVAFTELHANETRESASLFLANACAYFCSLGVQPKAVLTDNDKVFYSDAIETECANRKLKHRYTRPYRPQTNGKAERLIQSALRMGLWLCLR